MHGLAEAPPRRLRLAAAVVVVLALAGGGGAGAAGAVDAADTQRSRAVVNPPSRGRLAPAGVLGPAAAAPTVEVPVALRRYRAARAAADVAVPTAVRIPAIDVVSDLEHLRRDANGAVGVPTAWQRAGWFAEGARPGQRGPAVVLGHVDSRDGPAVFARLDELAAGDDILLDRADGTVARFVVERVERHPKDAFPTDRVYFPTLEPALRLVTCGGPFDSAVGHYRDNVVVFAALAADG